ncbi:hypothetical protein EW145_g5481 [Phellinidium pouzarii]|uniref:Plasma membrane fusion protein PRM1 n=1 Tax=Phellinidium pouzarii TaxID=167371 RepID=A0A4S4L002_9AGAM|nr:hypothetical protein EW145_g5481 [Phellinidium pouzarii]
MSAISPSTRRWMSPPPVYQYVHPTREGTTLKPYLTLPYILSLAWLAYPIISLLFIAFRLQISSASAQDGVSDAKSELLTSCSASEKAATVAASLPRYMAIGTNKQIASAVNDSMNAARAALVLALTILEAVINFAIDIYRSTFFCFLELVVRGGLSVLIEAVQDINTFLTSTFSSIRTTIQNDVTSINSAIQKAVDAINDVNPFSNITAPQFSTPDLSSLENVTLPSSVESSLTTLNSSLPTLAQIKDTIQDIADTPFEDLKADINNTFAGLNFNESTLFVPEQQTLSFCGDMDTSFIDDLGRDLLKVTKIGIIIIIVLALLLLGAHCALEWYKWRCLQQHLEYTRQAWTTDPTMRNATKNNENPTMRMTDHNLLVLAGSQQHPLLTRISNQLSALLRLSPSQQTNLQWFFHYVFHPPALACFLIGFFGLISVELQFLAIRPLETKYSAQVNASVSDFSNTIATSINTSMYNQSATYANQINSLVNSTQTTINDGLFGWVNGTTTTLNDTLVAFYSDIQDVVQTVFNGTVLENPIQEFVRCIIGSKIEALEDVLTFLHNNLEINIAPVNDSVLVLSQSSVDEATQPIAAAAVGDGSNDSSGLVSKLISRYEASLNEERIMFSIFIGLWLFVVLIALLIIAWHSYVKPGLDARRQKRFHREHRDLTSVASPFKAEPAYASEKNENEMVMGDLPSFTSALTPKPEGFFNVNLRSPGGRQPPGNQAVVGQHEHQHSWDSLLDSSSNQDNGRGKGSLAQVHAALKRKVGPPRKLMPSGKRAGKERFISDEERARIRAAEAEDAEDEAKERGWMKRLTDAFHKKDTDEENYDNSNSADAIGSSGSTRSRPNLTIKTSTANTAFANVARDQLPTSGFAPSRSPRVENLPPSAWSISPGPPQTLPWLPNLNTASKRPKPKAKNSLSGLPTSPRPVPRKNISFPLDTAYGPFTFLSSMGNSSALGRPSMPAASIPAATVAPTAQTPFTAQSGVPSYYHSTLPLYASRESLLPENMLAMRSSRAHKRTSSVPLLKSVPSGAVVKEHQQGISHGRLASIAIDPFRTPFDDDARVDPEQPMNTNGTKPHTNPFSPSAL